MASSRQIEETAAAWLAKSDRADWSTAEQAELEDWLRSAVAHRVAYLRLKAAWTQAGRLKALGAGVPSGVVPVSGRLGELPYISSRTASSIRPAPVRFRVRTLALLAPVVAVVLIGIASINVWKSGPQYTSYRTRIGGLESLAIADGSHITLNTNTDIRVAITRAERRVDLKSGEAFFEVAKDKRRPFVVCADSLCVIAVGTKFSVLRAADDDVHVVVTEGRVRIERNGGPSGQPPTFVPAGSIASASRSGVVVETKGISTAEDYTNWRTGYLLFHDTSLADAAAEFNRYNARQIVIADKSLATIRIGGNFRSTSLDAFVRLLGEGFQIRAEERDDRIMLTHR